MKTLYLHVGLRKTATSSIQATLYSNLDILRKNDIFYPREWRESHNLELYCSFCNITYVEHFQTAAHIPQVN